MKNNKIGDSYKKIVKGVKKGKTIQIADFSKSKEWQDTEWIEKDIENIKTFIEYGDIYRVKPKTKQHGK